MSPTYIFESLDHILAGLTIIGILISVVVAFRKFIQPHFLRQAERRRIIDEFIKELGNEAPSIIANNLKYLTSAVERLTAKISLITRRSRLGIYLCDDHGRCIWVNEPLAELFDLDKQDMTGYGWLKNIIDREKAYNNWKWSVDNGTPYRDTYQVRTSLGIRNCSSEAYCHLSEDGKVTLFYIGFVEEVHD